MANNFYAALFQDGTVKTYLSWEACSKDVTGTYGCLYKGFKTSDEQTRWLRNLSGIGHGDEESPLPKIYVDGSFGGSLTKAGWAWVCVKDEVILGEGSGVTPWDAESRNIDGECMAVMEALRWAKSRAMRAMIVHDYLGLSAWAYGEWKAKSTMAEKYVQAVRPIVRDLQVVFRHIRGHQGNKWNEYVDRKAKEARESYQPETTGEMP